MLLSKKTRNEAFKRHHHGTKASSYPLHEMTVFVLFGEGVCLALGKAYLPMVSTKKTWLMTTLENSDPSGPALKFSDSYFSGGSVRCSIHHLLKSNMAPPGLTNLIEETQKLWSYLTWQKRINILESKNGWKQQKIELQFPSKFPSTN